MNPDKTVTRPVSSPGTALDCSIFFALAACLVLLCPIDSPAYGQATHPPSSRLPGYICHDVYRRSAYPKGCAVTPSRVRNVPFTATLLTESETTTPDGATLTAQTRDRFARDSEGRTRTETLRLRQKNEESIPPDRRTRIDNLRGLIVIDDPVGHLKTVMYPNTLVARRFPTDAPDNTSGRPSGTTHGGPPVLIVPIVEEYLGEESVDGLHVQRYRVSIEYPVGDDYRCKKRHLVIADYWYSLELQITIATRDFDSRTGLRTTRLIDISRAEPVSALFEVPPEYKSVGDDYGYVLIPTSSGTGKIPEDCPEFEPPPKELGSPVGP
jgi:hypothetical protein